jgi:hypothetical protein
MLKRNPFGKSKTEIIPLHIPNEKTIYLKRVGAITPHINPVDLQELMRKRAEISAIILESISSYQKQKGVDEQSARDAFFPQQNNGNAAIVPANPMDYLDIGSKTRLLELQADNAISADDSTVSQIQIRAATLLLQYRLAYEIVVTETPKKNARSLQVEEPWFDLSQGDHIRFPGSELTVTEPYNPETGTITIAGFTQSIEAGSVGFLVNGKDYVIGNEDWTQSDTEQYCSITAIKLLWAFYEAELAGKPLIQMLPQTEETEPEPSGSPSTKNLSLSESKATPQLSTGEKSTGESSGLDVETTGSVQSGSETAPTG